MTVRDVVREAHQALRKAVPAKRRQAHAEIGILAATFTEAMQQWDRQKADGVPLARRLEFLTSILREAWPKGRANEWKYVCERCDDYGLVLAECPGDATCGRVKAHLPHGFGTPCWCEKGRAFKSKPKPSPEDFTAAGKSKLTRLGR